MRLPDLRKLPLQSWQWYLVFGLVMTIGYFIALPNPAIRATFYTTVGSTALLVIAFHVYHSRKHQPWTWSLLGLGLLLYFLGDFTYTYYRFFLHEPPPFPGVADIFFLLSRIPLFAGLIQLARTSVQRRKPFTFLDTLILATGLAMLWWTLLMAPLAYDTNYTPLARFVAIAYPALDFLLIGGGLRLALTTTRRTLGHFLFGAALAGLLISDVIYTALQLLNIYQVGTPLDIGWIWFYLLLGAAALYPEKVAPPAPPPSTETNKLWERIRLSLLIAAALLLPFSLALSMLLRHGWQDPALIAIGAALIVLAIIRLHRLMQANIALQLELAKLKSDVLFRSIVERAYSGVSLFRPNLKAEYHSSNVYKLADLKDTSKSFKDFIHPEDRKRFDKFWNDTLTPADTAPTIEYRLRAPNGDWIDVESISNNLCDDEWIHNIVLITRDITTRKQYERKLHKMAYTDPLTGLPNRAALQLQLEEMIAKTINNQRLAAVMFFDLDRFNAVNDSLGHSAGDKILVQLAQRLSSKLTPGSSIARFGADEFIITTQNVRLPADAKLLYQRLSGQLDEPFEIDAYRVHLTAGAGIALSDNPGTTPEELLRNADLALNHAKQAGAGSMRIYNDQLHAASLRHLELATALRNVLIEEPNGPKAPRLLYQPVVSLKDGTLSGAEALMHWHHKKFGYIEQDELISVATDADILDALETEMLDRVCSRLSQWSTYPAKNPVKISFNIAPAKLRQPGFDSVILEHLRMHRVQAKMLSIEINEAALIHTDPNTHTAIINLTDNGVGIIIDDFGREYTSLAEIYRLPDADLKIDRSLVASLDDPDTLPMLQSVIALAHALNRSVTAQGVDNADQAKQLQKLGCDDAQGSYYGRPASAEKFQSRLAASAKKPPSSRALS